MPAKKLVDLIGISQSKYFEWRTRYGRVNEHNALVPRDHWLEDWEKHEIIKYATLHPLDGYRRLTFMMLDASVAAASPASVYRVLSNAGQLGRHRIAPSRWRRAVSSNRSCRISIGMWMSHI